MPYNNESLSWLIPIVLIPVFVLMIKVFEAVALPFGAVASVMAFNRAARALRMILSRLFHLQATNFFDDFCQFEHELLSKSAWDTAEAVLSLLGWEISMGEDKRKPFAKLFEILGASINLTGAVDGYFEVSKKEGRLEALSVSIKKIPASEGKAVPKQVLESAKRRLLYAAGHTFGRCTHLACQLIHQLQWNCGEVIEGAGGCRFFSLADALYSTAQKDHQVGRATSGFGLH